MFTTKPKQWLLIASEEEKFQLYGILTFSKNLLQALITLSDMGFFVLFCFLSFLIILLIQHWDVYLSLVFIFPFLPLFSVIYNQHYQNHQLLSFMTFDLYF